MSINRGKAETAEKSRRLDNWQYIYPAATKYPQFMLFRSDYSLSV
jgi:hypothetical protein